MINAPTQTYNMVSSVQAFSGFSYRAYGLAIRGEDGGATTIPDISCDKQLVATMASLFNLCELPAGRAKNVIADLLP